MQIMRQKIRFAALYFFLPLIVGVYVGASTRPAGAADNQAVSVGPGVRYICQTSAPAPVSRARDWVLCSNGHRIYTDATNVDHDLQSAGSGYSTVADEGSNLTQRNIINFTGAGVSCVDNSGSSRTDCTISNTANEMFLSIAQYVAHHSITSDSQNVATGNEFYTTADATVTGVQTYWGAAATITVEIWSGGSKLASKSFATSGAGVVTVSFTSPVAVTAYTKYQVVTNTGAGQYYTSTFTDYPQSSFQLPFINGNHVILADSGYFAADAAPWNASTVIYPSFPVLTVP